MSRVQFEDEGGFITQRQNVTGLTGLVITMGLAQNTSQAKIVLLVIAALCIAGTVYSQANRPAPEPDILLTPTEIELVGSEVQ